MNDIDISKTQHLLLLYSDEAIVGHALRINKVSGCFPVLNNCFDIALIRKTHFLVLYSRLAATLF